MSFTGPAEAYDDYMGRYSAVLSPLFAGFAGVRPGRRVLDVGCGPGALTQRLVSLVGASSVAAADPSPTYVAACRARLPAVDVRQASAESLPWGDGSVDIAVAQLVVHFMADPTAGVREMRRVVARGGLVAGCTWDTGGAMTMHRVFWDAAAALDPAATDHRARYGTPGELQDVWVAADLADVVVEPLDVDVPYADFDDFWRPFTGGAGPAGAYVSRLSPTARAALRGQVHDLMGAPAAAFRLSARAWAVRGRA